jgi:DNA-binding MarR family transcriptional regulator
VAVGIEEDARIPPQQDLVARSMIDPSSMVAVVDELEKMGLAERRQHPADRRKHALLRKLAGAE